MRVRRLIIGLCGLGLAASPLVAATPGAAASLPAQLTVVGHGWGHGRGMGQYGAYGYALAGEPYSWILAHYYGGTVPGAISTAAVIRVHLTELDGQSIVTVKDAAGTHQVRAGQTFTPNGGVATVELTPGTWRPYQGRIQVLANDQTLNLVTIEQYVRGVVPAESPASWGVNGEASLQAQAVAARSYAWASTGAGANAICDTTSCQVYGGDPDVAGDPENSAYTHYSDLAQTSTAGQIRVWSNGAAALTQFSSSTGGYTAGGQFPAVIDAGDATPSNPNHDWTVTVSTASVQRAFPGVGQLQGVAVTGRNGLGDLGGRVTQMVLSGSAGRVTITGDQFASALGLRSDWFAITSRTQSQGLSGYWVVASSGAVYPYGNAPSYGSMAGRPLTAPIVGLAPTAHGQGYWEVAGDGGIFSFGNARFYGSTGNIRLVQPVIGMASTRDGGGYWLFARDGGIFAFGDARFYGSTGNMRLNQPIVGMATAPGGQGYWLVAADGGIFAFGGAKFYGSTGSLHLNQPIVGMVPTSDGRGYWLVGRDGGIFSFGDAGFVGSLPGIGVHDTIVSVTPTADNRGYLMVGSGGRVYAFGDAPYLGDPASTVPGWSSRAIGVFAYLSA